jgi:hypothetical protein
MIELGASAFANIAALGSRLPAHASSPAREVVPVVAPVGAHGRVAGDRAGPVPNSALLTGADPPRHDEAAALYAAARMRSASLPKGDSVPAGGSSTDGPGLEAANTYREQLSAPRGSERGTGRLVNLQA